MENIEFSNACKEVLEILKFVKRNDLEKIPKIEIDILERNQNTEYKFIYNPTKSIKDQMVSKMAKGIIAYYFYKYIAKEEQKEIIRKKQEYDFKKIEQEKKKQFEKENFKNIFKDKIEMADNKENTQILCLEKEGIVKKIIKKILGVFKRR